MMKDLKDRTREFALRIIRFYAALPKTTEAQVIGENFTTCIKSAKAKKP